MSAERLRVGWVVVGSMAACLAACDVGTGARVPDEVDIPVSELEIVEGQAVTLSVVARSGGEEWSPAAVWRSGSENTVLVTDDGVATGLRPGFTWVHATVEGVRDSVRVVVRFREMFSGGEVGFRVGGEAHRIGRLGASATFFDHLAGPGDVTQVLAEVFRGPEVVLSFPDIPVAGPHALDAVDPNEVYDRFEEPDLPGLGTFAVFIVPRDGEYMGYVAVSGTVTVEEIDVPAEAGRLRGMTRGLLMATAAEYTVSGVLSNGHRFEPTGRTEPLMLEFVAPTLHWPVATIATTLTGGPAEGAVTNPWAFSTAETGRIHIAHTGRLDSATTSIRLDAFIGSLTSGIETVDSIGTEVFDAHPPDSVSWAGLIIDLNTAQERRYGFSRTGSITLDSVRIPADARLFGVVAGTQTIELVIREPLNFEPTGRTTTLTSDFVVPIQRETDASFTPAFCRPGRRCPGS